MAESRLVQQGEGESFDLGRGVGVVIKVRGKTPAVASPSSNIPSSRGDSSSTTPTPRRTNAPTCLKGRSVCRWAMRS